MAIGLGTAVLAVPIALPFVLPPIARSVICAKFHEFGLPPPDVQASLRYCWRNGPGVKGKLNLALIGSPWHISAEFGASCCEWSAAVTLPKTAFDEQDALLRSLLEQYPVNAISNLAFSGVIAMDAKVERTFSMPVPVWSAKLALSDCAISLMTNDKACSITGFCAAPEVSGIAGHLDIHPIYLRANSISADGFGLTSLHASIRATEKRLLVTEASAGFCDGRISLFSLFLDPKSLNTGCTLYLDDIDAGKILSHFKGFRGEASGLLHGKIKLFVREGGKSVRLSDAFLYSTPGESGKIKLSDPTPITDNLALAGFDEAARSNVANALTDLDYSVLRLNLKRGTDRNVTLSASISGTATRGSLSVPVDLTVNVNGELEQLINDGLGYTNLTKGKQK